MDLSGCERQINRESSENNGRKSEDACEPHKPIRVNSNRIVHRRAGITDDIMAGSFAVRQSKTIPARSGEAGGAVSDCLTGESCLTFKNCLARIRTA
jgi:hypothetical protein